MKTSLIAILTSIVTSGIAGFISYLFQRNKLNSDLEIFYKRLQHDNEGDHHRTMFVAEQDARKLPQSEKGEQHSMADNNSSIAGSADRPIGNVKMFLEDIRARGFNPRGIIDVGANRGDWTRMALSVFPDAKVIMIEPQQEMREFLNQLCSENRNLEFIQAGAGREMGELVQTIWEDLAGSSFLPETNEEKLRDGTQRITPIITIDKIVNDRNGFFPDLVKLDIQGFELEALNGAISLFGKTQVFILETSLYHFHPKMPITADCINFMASHGYEFYDVTEYLRRPFDGALGQIDLAFALRGGVLQNSNKW